MAEAANVDTVNKDQSNVDWQSALEIIQTTVHALESDQRSLSKDAQEAWGRIEDLGLNKEGAKKFSAMLKKPVDKRRDEFRTFINLAKVAGWFDWLDDLVDRAETGPTIKAPPAVPGKVAAPAAGAEPDHPKDDSDLAGGPPMERVNLKSGWIQRVKDGVDVTENPPAEEDWQDVRQATPQELAAERDRLADFDDDAPAPDVEAAKSAVAGKVEVEKRKRGRPPKVPPVLRSVK